MQSPRTKVARHAAIAKVLAHRSITSQAELQEALEQSGVTTTQATLSRDLFELQATKVFDGDGRPSYALGGTATNAVLNGPENSGLARLAKCSHDLLVETTWAGNIAMLRTLAGGAQLMASALDNTACAEILGCVAGDDTVLVLCAGEAQAKSLTAKLLELAEEGAPRR